MYDMYTFYSFEERLVAQRKERELATQELGFKQQLSKEEKIEKKKQRLAAIGIDFYYMHLLSDYINFRS